MSASHRFRLFVIFVSKIIRNGRNLIKTILLVFFESRCIHKMACGFCVLTLHDDFLRYVQF